MIDEIILVGDQSFHRKCHYELFEKRSDRAMILASHSPEIIREVCTRALIVDQGHATDYSDVSLALGIYSNL